jgi:hypothetical protein
MIQNLIWATGYNIVALPLAAGILYSWKILLTPAMGAVFMSVSTVIVAVNAGMLRLKDEPKPDSKSEPQSEGKEEPMNEAKDDSQPEAKDESKPEAKVGPSPEENTNIPSTVSPEIVKKVHEFSNNGKNLTAKIKK